MSFSIVSYVALDVKCASQVPQRDCQLAALGHLFTFTKSTTLDPRAHLLPLPQLKVVSVIYSLHGTWTRRVASLITWLFRDKEVQSNGH